MKAYQNDMIRRALLLGLVTIIGLVAARMAFAPDPPLPPPSNIADACTIREERPGWYKATRRAARKWEVPPTTLMAIVWRESSFRARVRPPRRGGWWIFKGKPISTAYGFSQALDGTWDWYIEDTGATGAKRDSYDDAIDFVGWYMDKSRDKLGFAGIDAREHYLAYHQGHGGYRSGRWQRNARLKKAAAQVDDRMRAYETQLFECDALHAAERSVRSSPLPPVRPGILYASPTPLPKPEREVAEL